MINDWFNILTNIMVSISTILLGYSTFINDDQKKGNSNKIELRIVIIINHIINSFFILEAIIKIVSMGFLFC